MYEILLTSGVIAEEGVESLRLPDLSMKPRVFPDKWSLTKLGRYKYESLFLMKICGGNQQGISS